MVGKLVKKRTDGTPVSQLGEDTELDKDAFREIIGKIDQGLRALPATAQVSLFRDLNLNYYCVKLILSLLLPVAYFLGLCAPTGRSQSCKHASMTLPALINKSESLTAVLPPQTLNHLMYLW